MNELFQWIVAIIKGAQFWQIVLPWERAVRVRFGRRTMLWEPGFHWRIPYFDDVRAVNNRVRIASVPAQTIVTRDDRAVVVDVSVAFRIMDPLAAMLRLQLPEDSVAGFAQVSVAQYIRATEYSAINSEDLERTVSVGVAALAGPGVALEYARVVEFAPMRTIRLIQDSWRPHTGQGGL